MRQLLPVLQNYYAEDGFLALQESLATTGAERRRWQRRRDIHDQAYFVMLFAQFERHVGQQCESLIRRKRRLTNWQSRRAWELIDPERLSFRNRSALLTERGAADYNLIDRYYRIRCDLAHGALMPSLPVAIPTVVADLQGVAARLRPR